MSSIVVVIARHFILLTDKQTHIGLNVASLSRETKMVVHAGKCKVIGR